MEETKVVIIGGGVSGLCAAHLFTKHLQQSEVLLIEAAARPGGTSWTERFDGFCCDGGPNGFLDKEPLTLEWVKALGLEGDIVRASEASAHRFILKDGRLVEVVGPPRFFLAPLLSIRGRARLLCEPFVRAKRDQEPESIWHFAARRIGKEAADNLVGAMVTGVYGGDAKQLSLKHCFPRMAEMEREHGGLVKAMIANRGKGGGGPAGPRGVLTSFNGGIGALAERAGEALGEQLRLSTKATRVERDGGGYRVTTKNGGAVRAEKVVLALPAYAAGQITAGLDAGLGGTLGSIPYAHIAVVCTAYRREQVRHGLDGFGFLVPRNQQKRTLGSIWTSSIFPGTTPDGWVLLRTLYGGYGDPDAIEMPDGELLDCLNREVHSLLGIETDPEVVRIYRHPRGIPQYLLNHGEILDRLDAAEQRLPGLRLAGNAYRGVSLNDCVVSAHRAVSGILESYKG